MARNVTTLQEIALGHFLRENSEELLSHMIMYNTITKYMKTTDDGIADLDDILTYCSNKITEMVDGVGNVKGGSIKLKKNKTQKRK
jgi:hypothetical protein